MAKATLFQTSQNTRRGIIYALVFILAVTTLDFGLRTLESSSQFFAPASSFYLDRLDSDTLAIPELPLQSLGIANNSNPTFLVEGTFPEHPTTTYVHLIEQPRLRLDYESNAVRTATTLGFVPGSQYTSLNGDRKTHLLWENPARTRSLQYNAETLVWTLRTQYFSDVAALQQKVLLPNDITYINSAKNIISSLGFGSARGLSGGKVIATYALLGNDALFTSPLSSVTANYVVIDVFRSLPLARLKPTNQRPSLGPNQTLPREFDGFVYKDDPRTGSLHMVVSDSANNLARDIYELDFVDYVYRNSEVIRRIKSPADAWTDVREGLGKLRLLKPQTADYFAESQPLDVQRFVVSAPATELAYYEPSTWDGFVYPIYVFRGRAELTNGLSADFVFYTDALDRTVIEFR